VIPAGALRVRSNDTDYRFRAHSVFAHLTGLGSAAEPDAVLVLEPRDPGSDPLPDDVADADGLAGLDAVEHRAELFFRPPSARDSREFYGDSRYGELWVGPRPRLAEIQALTGIRCRHLDELEDALVKELGEGAVPVSMIRGADPRVERIVETARRDAGTDPETADEDDAELARATSELRLVKDAWEIRELRTAVEATARGFADIVRALPAAVASARGERVIEGVFELRAREEGNGLGYDTIAAAGPHACTLHWIRNDGPVQPGDLVLVDAGVERDSLYTADVTRTLPVSGTFSPAQRAVYEVVLEAADAAFAVAGPGVLFRDVHAAAMRVIATRLHGWGWLPCSVEESLSAEGQFHRRWMVHGTSHHLGLDVHDCARARAEMYLDAALRPGMVFTIEPGLYLMPDDLLVPEEMRGIGVRIEDDVLVTEDGVENLSGMLPRTPDEVEAWMAGLTAATGPGA
jgi:Xaa-Pro aminopeptidase